VTVIDVHGHYTTEPTQLTDFRKAQLAGERPTLAAISDDDVRASIEDNQLRIMRERGLDLVVFSPRFSAAWRAGTLSPPLPVSAVPADLAPLASAGRALYDKMMCATCHGADGRGHGPSSPSLKDEWGEPIRTADLTYRWTFKNGNRAEDLYRTIFGGLDGTPMPAYGGMLANERDRWSLVAAVLALSPPAPPLLHLADFAKQRATRLGPDGRVLP